MSVIDDLINGMRPHIDKLVNAVEQLSALYDTLSNEDKPIIESLRKLVSQLSEYLNLLPTLQIPVNEPNIFWSLRNDMSRTILNIGGYGDIINDDYQNRLTDKQMQATQTLINGCKELLAYLADFATQYASQFPSKPDS